MVALVQVPCRSGLPSAVRGIAAACAMLGAGPVRDRELRQRRVRTRAPIDDPAIITSS